MASHKIETCNCNAKLNNGEIMKKIISFLFLFSIPLTSFSKSEKIKSPDSTKTSSDVKVTTSTLSNSDSYELLKTVDDRQRNYGDFKANGFVKEVEKNKEPRLLNSTIYRRSLDSKFMILFNKPKEEAGKAYLKIDKNLWNFDPGTGKWERRTEREKIGGTNSRRSDFDEPKLSEEYDVISEGPTTLGKFKAQILKLTVKKDIEVSYPVIKLWIDDATKNILKREEYALSGKLMRTSFYPKWNKVFSESKKAEIYVPEEIRIFDELEKGNSTIVVLKEVDLKKLEDNIFTKAWVESKSK